ncbi:LysR substrate-binding domain-containing protein [Duganella sp. Root1480D1]|uniref:LysR substrate-binding domain-containing protein n=1 Tax=Duganella sp. Root1480D1 TaxID=1736471 RepID=UPI00070CC635|nr:LysR substrate-binding domain-containing protein [Duganella sp. Root1480D1]KQZ31816.1 LysR family transcriptional regulator [Duganella sp. Root1480D1]
MLSTDDLRFVCALAGQPSLSATARLLDVTPSSVTQRLQTIEDKLRLKLADRLGRGIALTEQGQILAERAQAILADMEALHLTLHGQRDELAGRLRVLAPMGFGSAHIAPLVARFRAQHPALAFELELSDRPNLRLHEGWDLVIHIGALRESSLRQQVLARNRRYLCAAPSYLARHGFPQKLEDLAGHACLALRENEEDATRWKLLPPGASQYRTLRIEPALACNDGRVIKQWALEGHGIMLRSEWDVASELRSGALCRLLPDHRLSEADIVALLPATAQQRPARTRRFVDFLKQEFARPAWLEEG